MEQSQRLLTGLPRLICQRASGLATAPGGGGFAVNLASRSVAVCDSGLSGDSVAELDVPGVNDAG